MQLYEEDNFSQYGDQLIHVVLKLRTFSLSFQDHQSSSQRSLMCAQMVTRMGLFGLGVPEIAVIAGVAVLIFGMCSQPPAVQCHRSYLCTILEVNGKC